MADCIGKARKGRESEASLFSFTKEEFSLLDLAAIPLSLPEHLCILSRLSDVFYLTTSRWSGVEGRMSPLSQQGCMSEP